ncbi:MAG: hypothetical protein OJF51_002016 [Nitrospira sp.]|jgi:hypothetical protein|nr:MAG: hypothetical protein OJF51_002016 [Nitrospira sp.]
MWKDRVKVLDLVYPGIIVVANIGDGNVFVSKIDWTVNMESIFSNGTIPIYKTVAKEQGLQAIELQRSLLRKREFEGSYIRGNEVPNEMRMKLWQQARSSTNECWDVKIHLAKPEILLEAERVGGEEFWSVPIKGTLYFYSLHAKQTLEQEIPLFAFVVKNHKDSKC